MGEVPLQDVAVLDLPNLLGNSRRNTKFKPAVSNPTTCFHNPEETPRHDWLGTHRMTARSGVTSNRKMGVLHQPQNRLFSPTAHVSLCRSLAKSQSQQFACSGQV